MCACVCLHDKAHALKIDPPPTFLPKSLKPYKTYVLCKWIIEEPSCLILTPKHVPRLRYSTDAQGYTLSIHCAESLIYSIYILHL